MKRPLLAVLLLSLPLLSAAQAVQAPLGVSVGGPAPALNVKKWVKGEPVNEFKKGDIYVVEFWATWCAPCKESIPHITEMQRKYPSVKFIGVSVWEEKQANVRPFVQSMGAKMDYSVAMDNVPNDAQHGLDGAMAKTWLAAAGQNGIPTAFIVDRGSKVAWIGQPMEMEPVLSKVAAGTWDPRAFAIEFNMKAANAAALQAALSKFTEAMRTRKWDDALSASDEITAAGDAGTGASTRFQALLAKREFVKAYEFASKAMDGVLKDDSQGLNMLAWAIVDPSAKPATQNLDLALKAASRSVQLKKSSTNLDTLARVYFTRGDKSQAVKTEQEAISIADEAFKPLYEKNLKEYQSR